MQSRQPAKVRCSAGLGVWRSPLVPLVIVHGSLALLLATEAKGRGALEVRKEVVPLLERVNAPHHLD